MQQYFRRQNVLANYNNNNPHLLPVLSAWDLTLFGIGAIIGAGIFIITGIAAAKNAGPAIIISFLIAGLASGFAGLCYAELAASVRGAGSAYGYAYAGLGELPAWIIGWDLLLEYGLTVSAVSVGWSAYFDTILQSIGLNLPKALLTAPADGGIINLPAMAIVLFVCILLLIGVKNSARFNALMVLFKISVLGIFIFIALRNVHPMNWIPFAPYGWSGIMSGASLIFFAYIGFDAVSTAAEEARDPARDLPIGILGSLVICMILYVTVAALLTSITPYQTLNVSSPISSVLLHLGYRTSAALVSAGALAGLTTVILVMYYGLTRICYAISRDGLLPRRFSRVSRSTHVPYRIILFFGVISSTIAGFFPLGQLAELINIGTLAAFVIVCCGVMVMRITHPDMPRPFKTPFHPLLPLLGIVSCLYLMVNLPLITWIRFMIWMGLGLLVYFVYSKHHSRINWAAKNLQENNFSQCN